MGDPETKRALRGLRRRAEAELLDLERERERIERLIEFIDEYAADERGRAKPRDPKPRRRRSPSLLDVIRERPGVRTSMLALVTGRTSEDVASELADLQRHGAVGRAGLGWRASDA